MPALLGAPAVAALKPRLMKSSTDRNQPIYRLLIARHPASLRQDQPSGRRGGVERSSDIHGTSPGASWSSQTGYGRLIPRRDNAAR